MVLALVKALPDTSLFHAEISGGPEYRGWGRDRHLLADLYNAVIMNTTVSGHWADGAPDIPMYPRPGDAAPAEKPKQTVKSLWAMLNRGGTKK